MKIKPEHLATLQNHIKAHDTPERRLRYLRGEFPHAARVSCLDTRYRWDLFKTAVPVKWVCDVLYEYLNDTHIATALRAVVPPLEKP